MGSLGKHRVHQQFECGDVVYIWREPGKRDRTKNEYLQRRVHWSSGGVVPFEGLFNWAVGKVTPLQLRLVSEAERTLHDGEAPFTEQHRNVEDQSDECQMSVESESRAPDEELDEDEPEPMVSLSTGKRYHRGASVDNEVG